MNKREVMKVENLVRNYKMVYSDRQGEEEIKVLKAKYLLFFFIFLLNYGII